MLQPSPWVWTCLDPNSDCSPDRHVFEDTGFTIAPQGNARCMCGQVTWDEAVQAAWKRYVAETNRSQETR